AKGDGLIIVLELVAATVPRQHIRLLVTHDARLDDGTRRKHDRTYRQTMRSEWREDEHIAPRRNDRPSDRERIGRRAGGCRDNQSIGPVVVQVHPIDGHTDGDEPGRSAPLDDEFVERPPRRIYPEDLHLQQHAILNSVLTILE